MSDLALPRSRAVWHDRVSAGSRSEASRWGPRFVIAILLIWTAGVGIGFESALTLTTFFAAGAAVIGIVYPVIGLLGVGVLCALDTPIRVMLVMGTRLPWSTFDYWLLLVALLGLPCLLKLDGLPTRIFQALTLLLALEVAYSPDRMAGFSHLLRFLPMFGMLVYFYRAACDKHIWHWLGFVNGTLTAAGGLVYWLQHHGLQYVDTNAMGYVPLMGIFSICLASHFGKDQSRGQLTLRILASVNFMCVVVTGSRQAMIIAMFCMLYLVLQIPGTLRRLVCICAALLVAVVCSAIFTDRVDYAIARVNYSLDPNKPLATRTSGRSDLVLGGWRIFLDHPLGGVGTGGFSTTWAAHDDTAGLAFAGHRKSAHSGWIKTLAENGIPGFLLLAGFVLSFAIVGWRKRRQNLFLFAFTVSAVLALALAAGEFSDSGIRYLVAGSVVIVSGETGYGSHKRFKLTSSTCM